MKRKEKSLEVPISAMIDVVFLLLIYFVFTAKVPIDEVSVSVNLPGPPDPILEISKVAVDVKVYKDKYIVNGSVYDLQKIEHYFQSIATSLDDVTVDVKVNTEASHQKVVLLLDRLKKAELSKFNLHTMK